MADSSRITHHPAENGSRVCLRDTDISISTVLDLLAAGRSEAEILQIFPKLNSEDIREALAYAAKHFEAEKPVQPAPSAVDRHILPWTSFRLEALSPSPKFLQPPRHPAPAAKPHPQPKVAPQRSEEPELVEAGIELYHPAYPDKPTIILSHHGLFDRRWATGIVAWRDIRDIRRVTGEKTIAITLRSPQGYLSSMSLVKRFFARVRLFFNLRTLYLDTASLEIRTRELLEKSIRFWVRYRGAGRKKRRIKIGRSKRSFFWDDYIR